MREARLGIEIRQLTPQGEVGACFNKDSPCCVLTETGMTPSCLIIRAGSQVSGAQREACTNAQAGLITPFIYPLDNKWTSPLRHAFATSDLRRFLPYGHGRWGIKHRPRQFSPSSNYFWEFSKGEGMHTGHSDKGLPVLVYLNFFYITFQHNVQYVDAISYQASCMQNIIQRK